MSASILKEFLVKIGFKVQDDQFRRFDETMSKVSKSALQVTKRFAEVATASIATGAALGVAMAKTANALESVYFSAQRTGASAKELDEFAYAAERIGISADQARQSVEAMAYARRNNPGLNAQLAQYGIDPKEIDNAKVLLQLITQLEKRYGGKAGHYISAQILGNYGVDEGVLTQIENNPDQFKSALNQREQQIKKEGISLSKQAAQSHEFMNKWAAMQAGMRDLNNTTQTSNMGAGGGIVGWLERITTGLTSADKATGGWSSRLIELGAALGGIKASGWLMRLLAGGGRSAAGVAGEGVATGAAGEVAAGAAEAGGAGLLGTVALPAIIIAAVGAALVWMMVHKDQVRKVVGEGATWVKNQAQEFINNTKQLIHPPDGWVNALKTQPDFIGDLARMVGKFEGYRDHVYKDVGGKATYGFGHLVKPGEDMTGVNPIALFMGDLQKSLWAVARNVKVRLSDNQRKALADLEFNIGEKAFRGSTLVRKLNAGDYEGAADHFSEWNKVLMNGHKVANATLSQRRAAEAQLFRTPDSKSLNLQTTINVEGGGDPRQAARETAREQNRVYGDVIRNFAPAVQ